MSNQSASGDNYDRGITPAETAARSEREGADFKEIPKQEDDSATEGYAVDREGLGNIYPVEPEMYVDEPGDRQEQEEAESAERAEELKEINEPGGKGPGLV